MDFVWPIVFNEWDNLEIIHYSLWFGTKIGSKNNTAISTNKYCNRCKLINSIKLPNNDYLRRLNERVWGIMAIRMFMGWRMFPFMCFYQQILFLLLYILRTVHTNVWYIVVGDKSSRLLVANERCYTLFNRLLFSISNYIFLCKP